MSNVCHACVVNSQSPAGSDAQTNCSCNAGWTGPDRSTCTVCAFGTYKPLPGSVACTGCGAGKYSAVTGSVSNVCACNAGSTGSDGLATCTSCAFSTYKTGHASASCTGCGAGKFFAVTASISNVCACNAGSTGLDGAGACTSCAFSTYKADPGPALCTSCCAGKFSAVTGSVSNVCACNAGSTGSDGADTCASCAFGAYKTDPGSAVCTRCGTGKFSAVTGSTSNVCACNARLTGSDGAGVCVSCTFGTDKTDPG